jgi:hypothetical protein
MGQIMGKVVEGFADGWRVKIENLRRSLEMASTRGKRLYKRHTHLPILAREGKVQREHNLLKFKRDCVVVRC